MTYLRRIVSRLSTPIQNGYSWDLYLECGHTCTRTGGQRGGKLKKAVCFKCQLGEKRAWDTAPF